MPMRANPLPTTPAAPQAPKGLFEVTRKTNGVAQGRVQQALAQTLAQLRQRPQVGRMPHSARDIVVGVVGHPVGEAQVSQDAQSLA